MAMRKPLVQSAHDARGLFRVLHEVALGELELDELRVDARRGHHCADARVEILLPQLARRKIDGDGQRAETRRLPGPDVGAGASDRPLANRHDEPRLLEDRDELVGQDEPALGMAPSQQRFGSAQLPAGQLELRLVEERELVALEGTAHRRRAARALWSAG